MRRPNFFILGAPKCGTTALAEFLSTHPSVFFSDPKEPHFFSADINSRHRVDTLVAYERLFAGQREDHKVIAEGSVHYLQSAVAVKSILDYSPDARFLVMLRNPVDLALSWHSEAQYSEYETERDFEKAWTERVEGGAVFRGKGDPDLMNYGKVASIGSQLKALFDIVPNERVKVILHEDFSADNSLVYRDVLSFLGLEDDGRVDFPRVNESKHVRSFFLMGIGHRVAQIKRALGINFGTGILEKANVKRAPRASVSPELRVRMIKRFSSEVDLLENLLGKDLSSWRC